MPGAVPGAARLLALDMELRRSRQVKGDFFCLSFFIFILKRARFPSTCWLKLGREGRREEEGKVSGPRHCQPGEAEEAQDPELPDLTNLPVELYNLASDPQERRSLVEELPGVVEAMVARLQEELARAAAHQEERHTDLGLFQEEGDSLCPGI